MEFIEDYSVEDFLQKAKNKPLGRLIVESHREFRSLQQLRITPRHSLFRHKARIEHYTNFVGEFCFLISELHKPAGLSDDLFQRTRPILEALIERNELSSSVLAMYR